MSPGRPGGRRSAAELVVDAAGGVALGADDVQAAGLVRLPCASLMSVPRPAMFVAIVTLPTVSP